MKRIEHFWKVSSSLEANTQRRKGSILVVVIALLGMLLLLGIAFFTFASQEQVSAENYSDSTKMKEPGFSPETLFNFGMEQLITGPIPDLTQSSLWGRRHSMMANMLGINANTANNGYFDSIPFNGRGIHLNQASSGNVPEVDIDFDNTADADQTPLNVNLSPPANGGSGIDPTLLPQPDVDYTYADINNFFLAHINDANQGVNGSNKNRVIVPSFFRPILLRDSTSPTSQGAISTTWYEDSSLKARSLRVHPEHLAKHGAPRFIRNSTLTPSATYASDLPLKNIQGNEVEPFPFLSGNGRMGVWTGHNDDQYDFDADNDDDGTNEGIWVDLDHPMQTLPDGRTYIPLFSFTVLDADGLINLNTAGNLNNASANYLDASSAAMQYFPISTSHLGVSHTEVNPLWALWGWSASASNPDFPNLSSDQKKDFQFFIPTSNPTALDGSMSRLAIANMELIHLKNGQKRSDGSGGYEYNVGEWGETETLLNIGFTSPGTPNRDDDYDNDTGTAGSDPIMQVLSQTAFPGSTFPSGGQPLDLRGFGSITSYFKADGVTPVSNGLVADLSDGTGAAPSTGNPNRWLRYTNYLSDSNWNNTLSGLSDGTQPDPKDEADETVIEPLLSNTSGAAGQTIKNDSVFAPEEMLGLHVSTNDFNNVNGVSRLQQLAPINFGVDTNTDLRKQFTSISFDRTEFGWPFSITKDHTKEFTGDYDNDGLLEFPPDASSGTDPFRAVVRRLFRIEDNTNELTGRQQFRLVLNGILTAIETDSAGNNRPIYRALTPHPTSGLTATAVTWPGSFTEPPPTNYSSNVELQEAYARYDRQRLARDIYVMLYMLGGGDVSQDYGAVSGSTLYTAAQLKEMAQFAVNLVDSLDRDNVITRFEYDKDLSNGWGLDDNPYADEGGDRAEVFGVEAQQLTLSEWLAVLVDDTAGANNPLVRHKTKDDGERWFAYLELKNASPNPVKLTNWGWRVRVIGPIGSSGNSGERRLTLRGADSPSDYSIPAGGQFSIATCDAKETLASSSPLKCLSSDLRIDYNPDGSTSTRTFDRIIPRLDPAHPESAIPSDNTTNPNPGADLDLVWNYDQGSTLTAATGKFLVTDDSNSPKPIGNFFVPTISTNLNTKSVVLMLERRLNLDRDHPSSPELDDDDNPWVLADEMVVGGNDWFKILTLNDTSDLNLAETETVLRGPTPTGKLQSLQSYERKEPLNGSSYQSEGLVPMASSNPGTVGTLSSPGEKDFAGAHSISGHFDSGNPEVSYPTKNLTSTSPDYFTLWQTHFDRELSSVFELLSIPLYGPTAAREVLLNTFNSTSQEPVSGQKAEAAFNDLVTNRLKYCQQTSLHVKLPRFDPKVATDVNLTGDPGTSLAGIEHIAATKFLRPNFDDAIDSATKYDNRWYRILELLEVPTQTNRAVQWSFLNQFEAKRWDDASLPPRLPGAINLNTVRHMGVLAGLIDDPDDSTTTTPQIEGHLSPLNTNNLQDTFDSNREWWGQFIKNRDRLDSVTNLYLPGLPVSRPYRSFGFVEQTPSESPDAGLQRTILRDLELDGFSADRRNLFEARNLSANEVDYHTRHRLLRKIANNSTNRSNVFIVYMSVGLFEAIEGEDMNNNGSLDMGEDFNGNGELDRAGDPDADVRIGAKLKNSKTYRGFFIVDRTLLEKAAIETSTNGVRFDYKKFIVYQKTLK